VSPPQQVFNNGCVINNYNIDVPNTTNPPKNEQKAIEPSRLGTLINVDEYIAKRFDFQNNDSRLKTMLAPGAPVDLCIKDLPTTPPKATRPDNISKVANLGQSHSASK